MQFSKLRVLGFKSFVEPTEFVIEDGLTGVVGPNGCGKSNLVEALRWVMGENSYKNMRASGMDDVIFSGSGSRPARNTAEVTLFLNNSDRTAPAAFNDADELQVSRRIERESGSVYRINGKDVRAKDVQLLFADASTGARSPSMVGQGRIGELISAKPQARRALLEEAAGISGLHSRRHEAELRLRAAETNLERLEDVVAQMDSQLESLKRQARQANRYKTISEDIRKTSALSFHLKWTATKVGEGEAESQFNVATKDVGERAEVQAESAKVQAILASKMPALREDEAKAAAALQRITIARNQVDAEIERMQQRKNELENRIAQLDEDIAREQNMAAETTNILKELDEEEAKLSIQSANVSATEEAAKEKLEQAAALLGTSEKSLGDLTAKTAEETTRKILFERAVKDASERKFRVEGQIEKVNQELAQVAGEVARLAGSAEITARAEVLEQSVAKGEKDLAIAEESVDQTAQLENESRLPVNELSSQLSALETEARTLNKILNQGGQDLFPAVVEKIKVQPGFEAALGAALGDDLEVSTDNSAPAHWGLLSEPLAQHPLPAGCKPLSDYVKAPAELARRLSQIGVVDQSQGTLLSAQLLVGQRLVSPQGDLWRWDGYQASAEAPTAAAQRLAQKNRLTDLDSEAVEVTKKLRQAEVEFETAKSNAANAKEQVRTLRDAWRERQRELENVRNEITTAERAASQFVSRKSALEEASARLQEDEKEVIATLSDAQTQLAGLADIEGLETELNELRTKVANDRAVMAEVRAAAEGLSREAEARGRRLETIKTDRESWLRRAENAKDQIDQLSSRKSASQAEFANIEDAPDQVSRKRNQLNTEVEQADLVRKEAADILAKAETDLAEADKLARQTISALSEARETRARAEERVNAAKERRSEVEARIVEDMECQPHETLALAEHDEDKPMPALPATESKLDKLKIERERLGAVNLRAEFEQTEITEQRDALVSERDDLIEAIRQLRNGINSLNKEGRERLLEAFDIVNDQFQRLFTHLFGGGTAELQLIESDDPLEAGLEILARPPGKKPQTMTLLSGGEQALTAMALIFAVFLTNPAPICVLDEVDAPLDDHNVERFCNLMDEMASSTDTRFVTITHNPITMARMSRLFGVTMAERGVSQLVSVDLQEAERIKDAG